MLMLFGVRYCRTHRTVVRERCPHDGLRHCGGRTDY